MARVLGLSMVISDGMFSTIALVPQVRDNNFSKWLSSICANISILNSKSPSNLGPQCTDQVLHKRNSA